MIWVLMILYNVVLPCMHNNDLIDYVTKVLIGFYEVVCTCIVDVWSKWYSCDLYVSLLNTCEVMVLHMYIALVVLYWGYE